MSGSAAMRSSARTIASARPAKSRGTGTMVKMVRGSVAGSGHSIASFARRTNEKVVPSYDVAGYRHHVRMGELLLLSAEWFPGGDSPVFTYGTLDLTAAGGGRVAVAADPLLRRFAPPRREGCGHRARAGRAPMLERTSRRAPLFHLGLRDEAANEFSRAVEGFLLGSADPHAHADRAVEGQSSFADHHG